MMREKAAAYQVEAVVAKWESKRIGDQRTMPSPQVRGNAVEIRDVQRDSLFRQLQRRDSRDFAMSGCNFQQREVLLSGEP
jgi:hypothetical protein